MDKINLGWDIGGANTKICVFDSKYNIIECVSKNIHIWENFEDIKYLFHNICAKYKDFEIVNYITITAESCDNFISRADGIINILEICNKNMCGQVLYYLNNNTYAYYERAKKDPYKLFSTNWMLTYSFLNKSEKFNLLLDIGSTTTDIIYKNMKINNNITDFHRLSNKTLLYAGVVRTPISMLFDKVFLNDKYVPLINEVYSTTGDIFTITNDIFLENTEYLGADNLAYTKKNSLIRLARNIGIDYEEKIETNITKVAENLKTLIIEKIFLNIKYVKKNDFTNCMLTCIGEGRFLAKELCDTYNLNYIPIKQISGLKVGKSYENAVFSNFPSALVVLNHGNIDNEKISN